MTAQVPETNTMPCTDQKPSFQKRRFLWACALAATAALPAAALAERFPERPISFVVPFPPGGPTDAMARTLAISLTETLGQSVIVENRSEEHTSELQSQSNLV